MKICAAQTRPYKGDISKNIEDHKNLIDLTVSNGADIIVFPELSLTGYEPGLAGELATDLKDNRLDNFQSISTDKNIIICAGLPTVNEKGIRISMVIFQPGLPRQIYSKQFLHPDELPYFVAGIEQVTFTIGDDVFVPAICYESLQDEHSEEAFNRQAGIYAASVAKSIDGVEKAFNHFPEIAKKYSMTVLLSNCVGPCDNFESAGSSAVWSKDGSLRGKLDSLNPGLIIYDTNTYEVVRLQN